MDLVTADRNGCVRARRALARVRRAPRGARGASETRYQARVWLHFQHFLTHKEYRCSLLQEACTEPCVSLRPSSRRASQGRQVGPQGRQQLFKQFRIYAHIPTYIEPVGRDIGGALCLYNGPRRRSVAVAWGCVHAQRALQLASALRSGCEAKPSGRTLHA